MEKHEKEYLLDLLEEITNNEDVKNELGLSISNCGTGATFYAIEDLNSIKQALRREVNQ